jgi:Zn-finger nucleic acid-binding protein
MQAQTLNCPMCGAAAETEASRCQFCGAKLATISCPSCFALIFQGSKHCPHCGAEVSRVEPSVLALRSCPRCRLELRAIAVGTVQLRECDRCDGLWVELATFEKICADREEQAAVLGAASPAPTHQVGPLETRIRYVPCPECSQLMNRVNFARYSGVVIDVCKGHGTWFDRDELTRIIDFIRAGGLEAARQREKAALAEERRRLERERAGRDRRQSSFGVKEDDDGVLTGIASTGNILKLLLG